MPPSASPDLPLAATQADWQLAVARGLNREADRLFGVNPELALERVEAAERIARGIGANGVVAISLLTRARIHNSATRFEVALSTCHEAASIAARDGEIAVRAATLTGLSAIWASLGLGEEALPYLEAAAELLVDGDDPAELALVRSLLGGVEAQLGRTKAGRHQFELALSGFRALGLRFRLLETRHNIACLDNLESQFADALTISLENAADAKRFGEIALLAYIEATCVEALCGLGRFDEAVVRARAALAEVRRGSRGELDILLWLGIALDKAGHTGEALATLRETEQRSALAGMPPNRELLGALARICRETGQIKQAEEHEAVVNARRQQSQEHVTRMRLKALEMTVELQGSPVQVSRTAADRSQAPAHLGKSTRRAQQTSLLTELRGPLDDLPRDFDGQTCGFSLVYQPIVNFRDGSVAGFAALLRLNHPLRGDLLPLEFIGRLEADGEISMVDNWARRKALADLSVLQRETNRPMRIAVNVSPSEFDQPEFADELIRIARDLNLEPAAIELRVTAAMFPPASSSYLQQLQQLRDAGIHLAMDDAIREQADVLTPLETPVSRIRIARNVVSGIGGGERQAAILRATLRTANRLQLPLVAEGIENAHQLAELRALGCGQGQGFLFSAGVPFDVARVLTGRGFAV